MEVLLLVLIMMLSALTSITIMQIYRLVTGTKRSKLSKGMEKLLQGPVFESLWTFTWIVSFEEIVFRLVLIGAATALFGHLILFCAISAVLFGAAHIPNAADRQTGFVLGFVMIIPGVALAFIYVHYGFAVVLLTHLIYDYVIYGLSKIGYRFFPQRMAADV